MGVHDVYHAINIERFPYRTSADHASAYKTASFQKEAMRTQVAFYFFYEVKFL